LNPLRQTQTFSTWCCSRMYWWC